MVDEPSVAAIPPIRFMSFNIRFDTVIDEAAGNRWPDRFASVVATIRNTAPDVIGIQEALRGQVDDLTVALPDYRGLGKPREIGDTAEYVPLFFRTQRFEVLEHGDFWMSPTPEVEGSRGWDTDVPRHCTWAALRDHAARVELMVLNTHLDRWGEVARLESARLVAERIALTTGTPSVVLGDLNALEDSEPLVILKDSGLRDSFRDVYPTATNVQTIHHYRDLSGGRKIDYVLCDERWRTVAAGIVREHAMDRLPSDHFPVFADLVPVAP